MIEYLKQIQKEKKKNIANLPDNVMILYNTSNYPISIDDILPITDLCIFTNGRVIAKDGSSHIKQIKLDKKTFKTLKKLLSSKKLHNQTSCMHNDIFDDGGSTTITFRYKKHVHCIENFMCDENNFCKKYNTLHHLIDKISELFKDIKYTDKYHY